MSTEIPESMQAELARWNNGSGMSLKTWAECEGDFKLAAGYAALLWPNFETAGKYILVEGQYTLETIAGFEAQENSTPLGVEAVLNHQHLSEMHIHDEQNLTADMLLFLGKKLKGIYEAKLQWQFPERPCTVELYIPEDPENLIEYQITFWQKSWEGSH